MQLDFGEREQQKIVRIIDLEPGLPAKTRLIPLTSGKPLVELKGTPEEVQTNTEEDIPKNNEENIVVSDNQDLTEYSNKKEILHIENEIHCLDQRNVKEMSKLLNQIVELSGYGPPNSELDQTTIGKYAGTQALGSVRIEMLPASGNSNLMGGRDAQDAPDAIVVRVNTSKSAVYSSQKLKFPVISLCINFCHASK